MLFKQTRSLVPVASLVLRTDRGMQLRPGVYETETKAKKIPISHELHDIVKWQRPLHLKFWDPRKTGDLEGLPPIDPKWLKLDYQPFQEMIASLPKDQQKLFTVQFQPRKEALRVIKNQFFEKVRRHKYDGTVEQSIEHKVAWFTVTIRSYRDMLEKDPVQRARNGKVKQTVKELVEKRTKWLNRLRHEDYKRFEWLIEVLGVIYRPPVFEPEKIWRRKCVNRLTDMLCADIIKKKMDDYKAELEAEKVPFLQRKIQVFEEIERDEIGMNLPSSVAEELEKSRKLLQRFLKDYEEIKPLKEENLDETPVQFS